MKKLICLALVCTLALAGCAPRGGGEQSEELGDNSVAPLELTEEEEAALKRGRNLNSVKPPKNGNVRDYRRATGLESLFGYLYVLGRLERINELFLAIEAALEEQQA